MLECRPVEGGVMLRAPVEPVRAAADVGFQEVRFLDPEVLPAEVRAYLRQNVRSERDGGRGILSFLSLLAQLGGSASSQTAFPMSVIWERVSASDSHFLSFFIP